MKASYQLNARVSEETKKQFDEIVEWYRKQLKIGKVSKSEVLEDLIRSSYGQVKKKSDANIQMISKS
jgi:hypothetical protein